MHVHREGRPGSRLLCMAVVAHCCCVGQCLCCATPGILAAAGGAGAAAEHPERPVAVPAAVGQRHSGSSSATLVVLALEAVVAAGVLWGRGKAGGPGDPGRGTRHVSGTGWVSTAWCGQPADGMCCIISTAEWMTTTALVPNILLDSTDAGGILQYMPASWSWSNWSSTNCMTS